MYPYNFKMGQTIQTNVPGVVCDRWDGAHFQVAAANASAGSAVGIHAAIALTASLQTIITGFTQPSVPRNITIKGNAAGIAGNVVVTGTNYADDVITETIALNAATEVLGNKAFNTVTSVALPVQTNAGTDTVSIGFGEKLGLPYLLTHNKIIAAYRNNIIEGTAATVTLSANLIESNTIDLSSALNGTVVDVYLMV